MIDIRIKLRRSFQPANYYFGCSRTNNIDSVTNWQEGNATLSVTESGLWFCFAKKKGSSKYSTFAITVDCGGVIGGGTGGTGVCTIYTLNPFVIQSTATGGDICIISTLTPILLNSQVPIIETGLQNEISEIEVPVPEFLNQVDLRFLGEFEIPLHPNPKFTDERIFESVLKGRQFRHQNTTGDIFKKGFTGIDYILCRVGIERQEEPYNPNFVGTLNIKKTSVIDGGPSYPQLKLNTSATVAEILSVNYADYVALTNDYKFNIPKKFKGNAIPLYNGRMILFDIENELNIVPLQDFVNRVLAMIQAILDGCANEVRIGFMYQGGAVQHTGFGITRAMYTAGADPAWTQVGSMTPNATAKGFPQALVGKSFSNISDRLMGVVEYYLPLEAFLGEKIQLYSRSGDKLKNYGGEILPLFTHFGRPQNTAGQSGYKPSYLHWATHTASALALNKKHMNANRTLILQTNLFNAATYHKDYGGTPEHAIIREFWDGFQRYKIPNYIVAGIEAITFFTGAEYYLWEDATNIGEPVNRSEGETAPTWTVENQNPPRRLDYQGVGASQAMAKRIAVGTATINNTEYDFADIIDGTEKYLLDDIEVDYLTKVGFNQPKKINPCDWMEFEVSPVMAIVNEAKGLIAIWGTIAYPTSNEPMECDVYYRENGHNFKKRIVLSNYKNSLHIFRLDQADVITTVTPPIITSNPLQPFGGSSATFSTMATGAIQWYRNGAIQTSTTGTFTIANPTQNDVITAKRIVNGVSSLGSNSITVSSPLTNDVNVFVFIGESNAGSRNPASALLQGEQGLRAGVKIWNNNTNQLEQLNVGLNNFLGENDAIQGGWGWEVELANLRASGEINKDFVIVKTAQGGAFIGQYNDDIINGYFSIMKNRVLAVKNALIAEGKNPVFHVLYSQGINNATNDGKTLTDPSHFGNLSGIAYWKSATETLRDKLRASTLMGAITKISYMKFFGDYGTYLNPAIQQIVDSSPILNSKVETFDYAIQADGLHIGAVGTRAFARTSMANFGLLVASSGTGSNTPDSTGGATGTTITIIEPNKPQYYFSNGHAPSYYDGNINMPAVHKSGTRNVTNYAGKILSGIEMQSGYSMTNDLVWLKNNKIKVGLNLLRGGQIAWLSEINDTTNLVYNGYDGGLQVGIDAYQKKDGFTINGKVSNTAPNGAGATASYNNAQGGDINNNSQSLYYYKQITNGYEVKFRPIFYTIDCEWTQVTIIAKYTLQPDSYAVKVEYTYHSFRTDGQYEGGGFDGCALPACFLINNLTRYQSYTGNNPFSGSPVQDGVIPIQNESGRYAGSPSEGVLGVDSTEKYICAYNPSTNKTFGLYMPSAKPSEFSHVKQLEVYAGNGAGTEFLGGFTYIDFNETFEPILDRSNYTKTMAVYVMATPSPQIARSEAIRLKNLNA